MRTQSLVSEKLKARQNPYLHPELEEAPEETPTEPSLQQKRAYFYKLQEPAAYGDLFGETDEPSAQNENPASSFQIAPPSVGANRSADEAVISRKSLEDLLDEVLGLYKPHVARTDWVRVTDYWSEFLDEASRTPAAARRVAEGLRMLNFSLMPGEKVEFNRAPADRIINELKRLLE